MPWTQGKSPLSLPLSVVLATWSKLVAWKVVGQLFGFHWNTVRKAVKNAVDYGLANRDFGNCPASTIFTRWRQLFFPIAFGQ
jgi:hypothetical protein